MDDHIIIDVSPIAFSIGPVHVAWYGIMIAVAIVVLLYWTLREVRRDGTISRDTVINAAIVAIPAGIVFSRLLHVVDEWGYYSQNLNQIVGGSGLTIYGAVLGATLGIFIYSRFSRFQFARLADLTAPGIIFAQSIGRVGCTFNGCCYGEQSSAWWAIVYTDPGTFGPLGIPVEPTQVYEIFFNLAVFGLLFKLRGKLKPDGSLFMIYMGLYGAWRFAIGFLRAGTPFAFGLEQAQVIGILVLLVVVPFLIFKTRRVKPEAVAAPQNQVN